MCDCDLLIPSTVTERHSKDHKVGASSLYLSLSDVDTNIVSRCVKLLLLILILSTYTIYISAIFARY